MKKRLVAIIISLITVLTAVGSFGGITAYAETEDENPFEDYSIMNLTTPDGFYKTENPTGTDENTPLLFMQELELLKFVQYNYDGDNAKSEVSVYDKISDQAASVTGGLTALKSTNLSGSNALFGLNFVQSVSFDPTMSGRKDHVAFVGVDEEKNVKLVLYNAKDNKWSDSYQIGDMKSWVTDGTDNYEMEPHLSITAGDYNGNHVDTVVVFAAIDGTSCNYLWEFEVHSDKQGVFVNESKSISGRMISPKYKTTKLDKDYLYNYTDKNGKNRLCGQVATGDFDDDGKDDLAVMTWLSRGSVSGKGKLDYELYLPYLCVAMGDANDKYVINNEYDDQYIYNESKNDNGEVYDNSINGPGMTVGSFSAGANDTLVIGGRSMTIQNENGKSEDYNISEDYNAFAVVSLNSAGSISMAFYAGESIKDETNSLTEHTAKRNNETYPTSTLCAVAFDGPGTAEYLFMDGRLYTMSQGYPVKHSDFTKIGGWGDFGDISYISGVAVGNMDGNANGYEKIVFTLMEKNSSTQDDYDVRTIQIYASSRDSLSGAASAFACTVNPDKDVDDKGDDLDQGVNGIVVAVDCDSDGILAKFKEANCYYTDPAILAILQAAPYFSELFSNDFANLQNGGTTSLTISEKHGKAYGEENSQNYSMGLSLGVSLPWYSASVQADFNANITNGWEDSISYEVSEYFEATTIDQVIVYRIPVYMYTYEVYDATKKAFVDDPNTNMVFSVQQKPSYVQMSISEYNTFAAYYNKTMDDKNTELKNAGKQTCEYDKLAIIENLASLGSEGNPSGYNVAGKILGNGGTTSQSKSLGTAGGQSGSEFNITSEYTDYSSHEYGFAIGADSMWGTAVAKFGVNFRVEANWKYTNKTTTGYSTKASAYVGNLLSSAFTAKGYEQNTWESYGFTWDACIFSTEINGKEIKLATGEYYQDTISKVPIIGYMVYEQSIRSLPKPPKVENSIYEGYNETERYHALKLEWTPADNTSGVASYDILLYKNGEYKTIANVSADQTTYEYRDMDGDSNTYIFAVQPVTAAGVKGIRSALMYGYSTTSGSTVIKAEYNGIVEDKGETYYTYTLTQNNGTKIENFWLLSAGYMQGVSRTDDTYNILNSDGKTGDMSPTEWRAAINRIEELNGHLVTNEFSIKRDIGICLETKWTKCSLCGADVLLSTTTLHAHECIETHVGNICTGQGYTEYYCDNCKISVGKNFENGSHIYTTTTVAPTCCSEGYDVHYCIVCGKHYVDNHTEKDSNAHEYVTTEYCVCEDGVHHKYSKSVCKYCGDTQIADLGVEAGDDIQYQIETYKSIFDGEQYVPFKFCTKCYYEYIGGSTNSYENIVGAEFSQFSSLRVESVSALDRGDGECWYRVLFTAKKSGTWGGIAIFRIDRTDSSGCMGITDVSGTLSRNEKSINVTAEFLKVLFAETYDDADSDKHIYETGCYTNSSLTSQYKRCVLCGRLETESHVHDYTTCVINELEAGAETLENAKTTTVKTCWCGHRETVDGGEHEHTWVEGSQATCTYAGKSTRFCTTCGAFEVIEDSESVTDSSVHHWVTKVVEPTCTEEGYTLHYCDFCNDASISYETDVVAATGHVAAEGCDEVVDHTCTTDGYMLHKCSVCGEKYMDPWVLPAKGHNYVDKNAVVVAPTCSSKGYTVNYCTNCGSEAEYTNWTDIDEDNHTYIADVHNMTCVEKGYTVYTCQGCGDSYSLFFEDDENMTDEDGNRITEKDNTPSGHVQDESFTPVHHDATSTEDGYTEYLCKTCGENYKVYDEKSDDDATEVTIIKGNGKPSDSDGKVGDYYKDKKTGDIYRKFADGWKLIGNVKDLSLTNSMKEAVNINATKIKISFGENTAVSQADKDYITKYVNKYNQENNILDVTGVTDSVFDSAMTNLLIDMFADIGITESDINLFFANPNNTVDMWIVVNAEVKNAEIVGCEEPYVEYSFTVDVYARTYNASAQRKRVAMYTVKQEDFAADSQITVKLPVFGKLSVNEILHTSEDGTEIYDVFTEKGDKTFTYDKSEGTVTVTVGHFSNLKVKYNAGANGENIVTGDTNNIWLYVIIVLAAAAVLGFAVIRLKKTRNN